MKESIAFLGLGRMGMEMATRLLAAGHPLRVWNRTCDRATPLAAKGARVVDRPADAVEPGGIAFTMLADDAALRAVADDAFARALGKGGIHVSMSTIAPATARDLAAAHARHGAVYLGAPVFGRPDAAREGKLWIALSGEQAAKARVHHVLEVLGQGVIDFGDDPTAAHAVKLAGNFLIASTVEALGEAYTFAEKSGVDPVKLNEFLTSTLFSSPIHKLYGKAILEERFEPPGFALSLGAKDMRLLRDTARENKVPMPLGALLEERYLRSLARGRANLDWMAITIDQREGAGLPPRRGGG